MFRKDRSDEPIYWGLFGAGGMVIAILFPVLLIASLFLGCDKVFSNFLHVFMGNYVTLAAIVGCLILAVWHCFHRIFHGLHDLTIHTNLFIHILIYSIAALISLAFIVCALLIVFK